MRKLVRVFLMIAGIVMLSSGLVHPVQAHGVVGDGTAASCIESALDAALITGGTIRCAARRTRFTAATSGRVSSLVEGRIAMQLAPTFVRHIVIFKYKDGSSPEQIQRATDAFRALQEKIPGIRAFEHGINNSPEGKNLNFTHVYTLTFDDLAARDAYLPHPDHAQFGTLLQQLGIVEDVFVIDYLPAS